MTENTVAVILILATGIRSEIAPEVERIVCEVDLLPRCGVVKSDEALFVDLAGLAA